MLRDTLKQEIDQLSDRQIAQVADLVTQIKHQPAPQTTSIPFWQQASPTDRAAHLRAWVAQLPQTGITLADAAFDRESLYK
jgi:negative regulator of sigma E activity